MPSRTAMILGLGLCLLAPPAWAQKSGNAPDPILIELRARLERELGDRAPELAFEVPPGSAGRSLVMRYKTREYLVYPRNKAGRLGRELEKREGPDDEGLLLRIHLQPKDVVNQAVVPQTVREPYWSTFLNVYPAAGGEQQLYVALSFQGRTEKGLIQSIQNIVEHPADAGD